MTSPIFLHSGVKPREKIRCAATGPLTARDQRPSCRQQGILCSQTIPFLRSLRLIGIGLSLGNLVWSARCIQMVFMTLILIMKIAASVVSSDFLIYNQPSN
ncbi:MAG: hypothetical protein Q9P90_09460 [candidate division KSB1 bacterium]|nr:hypothetical protein [candidate division KSB1 bacterium]